MSACRNIEVLSCRRRFREWTPYLEAQPFWSDFHSTMVVVMQAKLKQRLPQSYSVWLDVHHWLYETHAEIRRGKPEDFVTASAGEGRIVLLPAPSRTVLATVRREGNKYLIIREVRSDRVITVLELLSPTNKTPGEDYDAFLAKRNEYLATRTNVVELDLHRTGRRMPMGEPAPPAADYYAFVSRAADFPATAIWPFSVRAALPDVAVPLKPDDGFIMLPLQPCFATAYEHGPYDKEVDYTRPPRVALQGEDALWAEALLKAHGG